MLSRHCFLVDWALLTRYPRHIQSVFNLIVNILMAIHVMVNWQLSKRVSADQCHMNVLRADQNGFEASWNDVWVSICWHQLAQMARFKSDFLFTLKTVSDNSPNIKNFMFHSLTKTKLLAVRKQDELHYLLSKRESWQIIGHNVKTL